MTLTMIMINRILTTDLSIRKTKSVKAKIKSAKNTKRKSMKLKLSGLSGCDGYQVQYSMKKKFQGSKKHSEEKQLCDT